MSKHSALKRLHVNSLMHCSCLNCTHVHSTDSVDVVGVLVPRWLSTAPGRRCELELVLVANNITRAGGLGRAGGPAAAVPVGGLPAPWDAAPPGSGTQSLPEPAALFEVSLSGCQSARSYGNASY